MTLLWIPLLSLIGSVISAFTGKLSRNQSTFATVLAPLTALGITLYHAPAVLAGETIRYSLAWIPSIGLDLSLRIDGLSLLFMFMVCLLLYIHVIISAPMTQWLSFIAT